MSPKSPFRYAAISLSLSLSLCPSLILLTFLVLLDPRSYGAEGGNKKSLIKFNFENQTVDCNHKFTC